MNRAAIVEICEAQVLGTAARLFGVAQDCLKKFADYEGCANLVYEYERDGRPLILRISFRPERPVEQIQAELHFQLSGRQRCACFQTLAISKREPGRDSPRGGDSLYRRFVCQG